MPIEDTVGAMAELVADGKGRHLGPSEAAPATTRELGIGFVAYSPRGRGCLTGTFTSKD